MKEQFSKKVIGPENYISATPLPSLDELQKFYSELYYQAPQSSSYQEHYSELELDYKRLKCNALIFALRRCGITANTFLDVGAGEGFLLNAANEQGLSVTGIDFSSFGVEKFFPELISKHMAGDLYQSLAKLASEGKRYALCSTTNVLEHVVDPNEFLTSIRKVMEPNGLLAITVPNDFSEIQRLLVERGMIEREFWFSPPHHLHYFNTQSLSSFLTNRGFVVVDAFSDFPVDLYLLHPGSNYVMDKKNGRAAHEARILHDLMIAKSGLDKYLDYYRAMFNVGIGRDITIIVRAI